MNESRIRALVGQGEATGMAQHVGMGFDGQACEPAIVADHHPGRLTAQSLSPLAEKEGVGVRLHPGADRQPCLDRPYLITPERVRGGQPVFEPCDMQDTAFNVHLGQHQAAGFGHAQAVPEHQEQQASVAGRVAGALGGGYELLDFGGNQVFSLGHHFVQCLGWQKPRNASKGAEPVFLH